MCVCVCNIEKIIFFSRPLGKATLGSLLSYQISEGQLPLKKKADIMNWNKFTRTIQKIELDTCLEEENRDRNLTFF